MGARESWRVDPDQHGLVVDVGPREAERFADP
jgi:hypothetical protein